MSAIFFLIGCSVLMALIFLAAFFWANKSGQHEDTYTPSVRILFDDELQGDVSHSNKEDNSSGFKPDLDSDTDPE
ncbi:MAG TPA: cbb3-type cytochrome oxidase assembly protein CcoS [Sphingobacteriaceae bacterium]|nr:cbb3-type cytochrome oxidase assembly protein CcoS [Sphingobacteriaceae bacterium]